MKTNLLFMLLGAALMYALMQLLEPSKTSTPGTNEPIRSISTPEERAKISTLQTHDTVSAETVSEFNDKSADDEKSDRPSLTSNTPSIATREFGNFSKEITNYQLRKSRKAFKKLLKNQPIKLQQLTDLARKKIEADMELYKIGTNENFPKEDFALYSKSQTELTEEDKARLQTLDDINTERAEIAENTRVEYADAVRNLLTKSELNEYKKLEANAAHQQLTEITNDMAERYKDEVPDLNDFQISEIDRLASELADAEPREIPIGSTLGSVTDISYGEKAGKDPYSRFFAELSNILSDEQIKAMQNESGAITRTSITYQ